ncbi:SagB family peptide dehydrogenase [Actinomyces howellii]|uniref:SagB family peptide dehydrogenase n=1 Tax=Actinomyces howellii TaxID=52771 RepID=UPI001374F56E|nr:SagB family peptide dehydrogenase [Actinomyces howellii]
MDIETWYEVELASSCHQETTNILARLIAYGWTKIDVPVGDRGMLCLTPREVPAATFSTTNYESTCTLSKFAVVTQEDREWTIELPHSWCDVMISDIAVVDAILEVGASTSVVDLSHRIHRSLFMWAGLLVDPAKEVATLMSAQWSPHELWFHSKTRRFGRQRDYGGTFWAADRFDPPPFQPKPSGSSDVVQLDSFDEETARLSFGTLYDVAERRKSHRKHDDANPIHRRQLSEFLYRTMRVRALHVEDGFEYANKPYPSGGSAYETETYLLVRLVEGVPPGLWRYDSQAHALVCVRSGIRNEHVQALLRSVTKSSTEDTQPQAVVFLAPRFSRIMWKYEQIGYSVMVKNVGVVMAMMSLVATDMGLACCAIGSGDSDSFNRAIGVDPLECSSVGEMTLGSYG